MNLKLFLYSPLFIVFLSCQQQQKNTKTNPQSNNQQQKTLSTTKKIEDNFTYKTIFSPDIGWGYQILNNGAIYINQPHIPAISGVKGFDNESDAITTAELMIYKLKNGIFPPTISLEELDSLEVIDA
jgi:hypothetical protein